jgi:predicted hotdog family 3-hydroxylacyl-ACP dehydratase
MCSIIVGETRMMDVKKLDDFLPHRNDMIWIDKVLTYTNESATCLVNLEKNKLYFTNDEIRQSSYIEWIAQSFGYADANRLKDLGQKKSLKNAFLVGITNARFSDQKVRDENEIMIDVKLLRIVGPISFIEGKVYSNITKNVYCEATLKVFSN